MYHYNRSLQINYFPGALIYNLVLFHFIFQVDHIKHYITAIIMNLRWSTGSGISQRWICVIMTFFSLFCAYTIRVLLSIAITEMVKPTNEPNSKFSDDTCPGDLIDVTSATLTSNFTNIVTKSNSGTYEWSEYTQVIIKYFL